jgi:hypothetical protein
MFLFNPLHKTLPTFVKVIEGCVIFKFASDHKVHFSLKIQRKTILKTAQRNTKAPNAETRSAATSCTSTSATRRTRRTHVGRARARHRSDPWSLRSAGGSSPVPSVASGPRQVALIHRPAHRPWSAIGRRSGARRWP